MNVENIYLLFFWISFLPTSLLFVNRIGSYKFFGLNSIAFFMLWLLAYSQVKSLLIYPLIALVYLILFAFVRRTARRDASYLSFKDLRVTFKEVFIFLVWLVIGIIVYMFK